MSPLKNFIARIGGGSAVAKHTTGARPAFAGNTVAQDIVHFYRHKFQPPETVARFNAKREVIGLAMKGPMSPDSIGKGILIATSIFFVLLALYSIVAGIGTPTMRRTAQPTSKIVCSPPGMEQLSLLRWYHIVLS